MASTEYEPGTVAVATIQGESVRVVADHDGCWIVFGHSFFKSIKQNNDHYITDIRPLVVLDLDDPRATLAVLGDHAIELDNAGSTYSLPVLNELRDQIREQTKPPRIPEPGLWGVVEAHVMSGSNPQATYRWVRTAVGWVPIGSMQRPHDWSDLFDPTLIREGVES